MHAAPDSSPSSSFDELAGTGGGTKASCPFDPPAPFLALPLEGKFEDDDPGVLTCKPDTPPGPVTDECPPPKAGCTMPSFSPPSFTSSPPPGFASASAGASLSCISTVNPPAANADCCFVPGPANPSVAVAVFPPLPFLSKWSAGSTAEPFPYLAPRLPPSLFSFSLPLVSSSLEERRKPVAEIEIEIEGQVD